MKNKIKASILFLLIFISVQSYSQLFKKKKGEEKSNDLVVFRDDQKQSELMSNGVEYFISDIIQSNDTNKIKEVIKSRNYSVNMLLMDPIDGEGGLGGAGESSILLQRVIKKCDIKTLKFFLDNGANPNLRAIHKVPNVHTGEIRGVYYSKFPLEIAAIIYDTAKMNLLIKYGANKSVVESNLKKIAYDGSASYNIDKIAFIDFVNDLYGGALAKDALIKMILHHKEKVNPTLIANYVKKGADINANDGRTGNFGESVAWTLLLHAIQDRLPKDCIKEIITQGANINTGSPRTGFAFSYFPLTLAVCNNDFELVKLLVEKGANLNVKGGCDRDEATPLGIAQRKGYKNIADYLFSKGAN